MKASTLFAALLVMVGYLLFAQNSSAQDTTSPRIDSFTTIDYDDATDIVTAYSETDLTDYDLYCDYEAYVSLGVTDDSGITVAYGSDRDYDDVFGFASVTLQFQGNPETTYTARGIHKAYAVLYDDYWDYDYYPYRHIYDYYDSYYFSYFGGFGIYEPWWYSFYSPGYRYFTNRNRAMNLGTTYDSAFVTIRAAHPTNFRQTSVNALSDGTLEFTYAWDSSTGNLADLSSCVVGEIVTYPGTSNPYTWPNPPFNRATPNPTIGNQPGTGGGFTDDHQPPNSFVQPYRASSFTATQLYRYRCDNVNRGNYVNLTRAMSIVRSVSQNADASWRYTVSKSGSSAGINPLP
jgi:hypothetical protein